MIAAVEDPKLAGLRDLVGEAHLIGELLLDDLETLLDVGDELPFLARGEQLLAEAERRAEGLAAAVGTVRENRNVARIPGGGDGSPPAAVGVEPESGTCGEAGNPRGGRSMNAEGTEVVALPVGGGDLDISGGLQLGSLTAGSASCAEVDSDRLYGDKDCDGTKDAGEEYLDLTGGTGPTGPAGPTGPTGATGPTGPAGGGSATYVEIFTADGTWTKATNCSSATWVEVVMLGGGGGGGKTLR